MTKSPERLLDEISANRVNDDQHKNSQQHSHKQTASISASLDDAKKVVKDQIQKLLSLYAALEQVDPFNSPGNDIDSDSVLKNAANMVKETQATVDTAMEEVNAQNPLVRTKFVSRFKDTGVRTAFVSSNRIERRRFSSKPGSVACSRGGEEVRGRFIRKRNGSTNLTQYNSCVSRASKYEMEGGNNETAKGFIEGGLEAQVYRKIISSRFEHLRPKRFTINN